MIDKYLLEQMNNVLSRLSAPISVLERDADALPVLPEAAENAPMAIAGQLYLQMKQPQYSRYERGLRDVPTDVLIRLAQLYNTTTDYLLGLTKNSSSSK